MRRIVYTLLAVVLLAGSINACGPVQPGSPSAAGTPSGGSNQINGAGATFPLPIYTEWTYEYQNVDPSVVINYQGIGSGGGKKGIIDRTIDFAGSDSLLLPVEYTAGKDLQMYPIVASAVVVIFNIDGYEAIKDPPLVLDGPSLVGIYNGVITNWNDPALLRLNPGLENRLPAKSITVVHRSDSSGTTEIFTKALVSFSSDWKAGGASAVQWPVDQAGNGIGGKGNPGIAAAVMNTPNSIGYVEVSYALSNKIPFASMVNREGRTVTANAQSLASAMAAFSDAFDDKLTATIVNAPGSESWPIAGYTYIILHTQTMTDCAKAQKLLQYIHWTLTDPQAAKRAADLGYAVLPGAVQKKVVTKLGEVTCNGNPVLISSN
ncbi:MAG TPA: phosphate ABC transporter substrate-binding protein PstS [Anaerolineaceae bacterium]|nr:phosphate ABC transporter substrate-binding protein PstS [Anaerolineaceae bacterium]